MFFHRKSRSFLLLLMYFLHSIRQGSRRLCLLQPLLYLPLPLADRLGRILPCDITVQIFQQVLSGGFELVPNQRQAQVRIARCCTSAWWEIARHSWI